MFQHFFRVKVGNEKRNVISLYYLSRSYTLKQGSFTHLDSLSPKNKECFRSLGQKPRELVYQNILNFICLFDLDAETDAVHARLNKDSFILISRHNKWV